MEGILLFRDGIIKQWKKRFARLVGTEIWYAKEAKDLVKNPLGVIDLRFFHGLSMANSKSLENGEIAFSLQAGGNEYQLAAPNLQEATKWQDTIRKTVQTHKSFGGQAQLKTEEELLQRRRAGELSPRNAQQEVQLLQVEPILQPTSLDPIFVPQIQAEEPMLSSPPVNYVQESSLDESKEHTTSSVETVEKQVEKPELEKITNENLADSEAQQPNVQYIPPSASKVAKNIDMQKTLELVNMNLQNMGTNINVLHNELQKLKTGQGPTSSLSNQTGL